MSEDTGKQDQENALDDEQLDAVAGGTWLSQNLATQNRLVDGTSRAAAIASNAGRHQILPDGRIVRTR